METVLAWEPIARLRTDAAYRRRVLDYLSIIALAFVLALSAYLISIRD